MSKQLCHVQRSKKFVLSAPNHILGEDRQMQLSDLEKSTLQHLAVCELHYPEISYTYICQEPLLIQTLGFTYCSMTFWFVYFYGYHSFDIPEMGTPSYSKFRQRVTINWHFGKLSLNPQVREFKSNFLKTTHKGLHFSISVLPVVFVNSRCPHTVEQRHYCLLVSAPTRYKFSCTA